ncbi:hypothetical protein DSO57_1016472 [Entomophthora muscae]|uniref:Uncharacterized protein n=1 Tax=Entomophthora muscae TaxID=34485 RepID=A0ACC2STL8_9FUNG|nr:hypothetical protein DSO57_1016472 [Entomophthora muscae]
MDLQQGSHTTQTVVLNTLSSIAHSSPPPNIFNIIIYSQAHFTAFSKDFPTDMHKVLFLAEKLTGHYCDWFSSHFIRNPEVLQDYNQFVFFLLSFSGIDKDLASPLSSCFSGLVQGSLPLRECNQKFYSLHSRLQASDAEACSLYKIGLNPSLQDFLVHYKLPDKLDSLIKEAVKWNQKYLLTKYSSTCKLSPNAKIFSSKTANLPAPPPGTDPRPGGGFILPQRRSLEEGHIIFVPTVDLRTTCWLSVPFPSNQTCYFIHKPEPPHCERGGLN